MSTSGPIQVDEKLDISYAIKLDAADTLAHFRSRYHIPSKADLKRPTIAKSEDERPSDESVYLCGNSLGLQPKSAADYIQVYLTQWRTKAVTGHFVQHNDSPLAPFLHVDDEAAKLMAPIVGAADSSEVAVMGTLTANLHLLMCSFYRPDKQGTGRYKILLEGKAFPSDHYAVESQVEYHGFDKHDAMILLEPEDSRSPILSTEQVLATIDRHANELALILLPGIQFYTGQYFDIKTITQHAHSKGILIGWDCAHAAGNVDLQLHEWNVDFAVWCTYKYLNSGPGAIGAIFVHERHGRVDKTASEPFRPRLMGWWGDDKTGRFEMANNFTPRPGAWGYQLSNPSALDLSAVVASLQIFKEATMPLLRQKSTQLTDYLEHLLTAESLVGSEPPYRIITPHNRAHRGAQLSIALEPGMLDTVLECLEDDGVVVDERKPDVIRVAPAPLYNSYMDVYQFCRIFRRACEVALQKKEFR